MSAIRFRPTTSQLLAIAELQTARMSVEMIAQRLGVDLTAFKDWTSRLEAARENNADSWRRENETALAEFLGMER